MIVGKFTCPHCGTLSELSATKAPPQQSAPRGKSNVGQLLQQIEDGIMMGTALDDRSDDFYRKTRERYDKWGEDIHMSDPQMAYLKSLAAKSGVD